MIDPIYDLLEAEAVWLCYPGSTCLPDGARLYPWCWVAPEHTSALEGMGWTHKPSGNTTLWMPPTTPDP